MPIMAGALAICKHTSELCFPNHLHGTCWLFFGDSMPGLLRDASRHVRLQTDGTGPPALETLRADALSWVPCGSRDPLGEGCAVTRAGDAGMPRFTALRCAELCEG